MKRIFFIPSILIFCISSRAQNNFSSFGRASNTSSYSDIPSQSNLNSFVQADFNEDGINDVAVIGRADGLSVDNITVFTGHCDDYLEDVTAKFDCSLFAEANNLVVGDYNNDTHLDIIVAGSGPVSIYSGDGNGGFTFATSFTIPSGSFTIEWYELASADFDHDTKLDLAINVTDAFLNSRETYFLNGNGNFTFTNMGIIDPNFNGALLHALDVNADGFVDLVQYASLILINNAGTFNLPMINASTMYVQGLKEVHYGNTDADAYIEFYAISDTIFVCGELNYNTPAQPLIYRIPATRTLSFAMGDFDYDGIKNDFAFSYDTLYSNVGFSQLGIFKTTKMTSGYGKLMAIDMNGNGSSLLLGNINPFASIERLNYFRCSSYFRFTKGFNFPAGNFVTAVVSADFDRDGFDDIAAVSKTSYDLNLYYGGPCSFKEYKKFNVNAQSISMGTGFINNDTFPDIVLGNVLDNNLYVYLNDGFGNFPSVQTFAGGQKIEELQVADLNNDGFDDVISLSKNPSNVGVHLATGTGSLGAANISLGTAGGITVSGGALIVKDYNDDGFLDVCNSHVSAAGYGYSILYGDGTGNLPPGNRITAVGDNNLFTYPTNLNADGYTDLVYQNFTASEFRSICADTSGQWTTPHCAGSPVSVTAGSIAGADFNNDAMEDFVLTWPGAGNYIATVIHRSSGSTLTAETLQVGNTPVAPAIGDINGDGKPDIIIGNQASNDITVYINNMQSGTVSIDRIEDETSFSISPNPASQSITINRNINEASDLLIYNYLGELMKEKRLFMNEEKINISDLESGVYFCVLIDKGKRGTRRMIVIE